MAQRPLKGMPGQDGGAAVIIPAPIRLCAIGPAVSPDVSPLGKEWGVEFVGSGAPGGSASASSTASPVSCPSPISVSTSPENVTVPSSRRGNLTNVGKTYRKDTKARQDLVQQNEDLKAQLLELQKHLGKDLLQHCKGLEKQLARKQKKVSALEAINESLRQQLSRQKPNLQCACTRRPNVPNVSADSVTGHPMLESVLEDDTQASSRGEDGPRAPHVRTWTRCLANGIVSPCRNVVHSENGSQAVFKTPVRAAQLWLERATRRQTEESGDSVNSSRDRSINDRSISFVAEVNAAISAHRIDTPGMEARANRHSRFALAMAVFCAWNEYTMQAKLSGREGTCCEQSGLTELLAGDVPTSVSNSFVDIPLVINSAIRCDGSKKFVVGLVEHSPTPLPCAYSPVNFAVDTPQLIEKFKGVNLHTGESDSDTTATTQERSCSPVPKASEPVFDNGIPALPPRKGDRYSSSSNLDYLRDYICHQNRERQRSRSRSPFEEASTSSAYSSESSSASFAPTVPSAPSTYPHQAPQTIHFATLC